MSMMRDFFGGVVDGLVNGAANQLRTKPSGNGARGRIDRLCRELGWTVDERDGNIIRLHFKGTDGEVRKVRITNGDSSLVGFFVASDACFPVGRVPANLMSYTLRRNIEDCGMGMWGLMFDEDDKDVTFILYYMALGDGLDAHALKYICESLASEASEFDEKLRKAGLLD